MAVKEIEVEVPVYITVRYDEDDVTVEEIEEYGRSFHREKTIEDVVRSLTWQVIELHEEIEVARMEGAGTFITDNGFQVETECGDAWVQDPKDVDARWPKSREHPEYDENRTPHWQ